MLHTKQNRYWWIHFAAAIVFALACSFGAYDLLLGLGDDESFGTTPTWPDFLMLALSLVSVFAIPLMAEFGYLLRRPMGWRILWRMYFFLFVVMVITASQVRIREGSWGDLVAWQSFAALIVFGELIALWRYVYIVDSWVKPQPGVP